MHACGKDHFHVHFSNSKDLIQPRATRLSMCAAAQNAAAQDPLGLGALTKAHFQTRGFEVCQMFGVCFVERQKDTPQGNHFFYHRVYIYIIYMY